MTRKDFIMLAECIDGAQKDQYWCPDYYTPADAAALMKRQIATNIADALARDNLRFDYDRFMKAAGVQR